MPMNRGKGQPKRWYQLCFTPSSDSSDDSDAESVVLPCNTSTSTWQEISPPEPSSSPPPNIELPLPSPPPPPPDIEIPLPAPPLPLFFPRMSPLISSPPNIELPLPPLPPPPPPPDIEIPLPPPPRPLPLFFSQRSPLISSLPPRPPSQGSSATAFDFESPLRSPSLEFEDHNLFGSFSMVEQGWSELDDQRENSLQAPHGVVIDAITRVKISELSERDERSHCPICMEEFKVGDQACLLPCIHTFCSKCILRWLRNNKTCPICRLQLDGLEGHGDPDSIDETFYPGPEISAPRSPQWPQSPTPPRSPRYRVYSVISPVSSVNENNSAGENSDEADLGPYHSPLRSPSPPRSRPPIIRAHSAWDYFDPFAPGSSGRESNCAGENSDESDHYDSACEELGDSHEGAEIVGVS